VKVFLPVLLMIILVTVTAVPAMAQPTQEQACWGQASRVFAQMGLMGEHASSFDTPRVGLRNLARELHAAGLISDDSMAALGAFVAASLGLTIEACQ
jgi:hypothetical protein